MAKLSDFDAVQIAEGCQEAGEEERVEAWQHLIDTGLCWRLQGWFGRTANDLIRDGTCERNSPIRLLAH